MAGGESRNASRNVLLSNTLVRFLFLTFQLLLYWGRRSPFGSITIFCAFEDGPEVIEILENQGESASYGAGRIVGDMDPGIGLYFYSISEPAELRATTTKGDSVCYEVGRELWPEACDHVGNRVDKLRDLGIDGPPDVLGVKGD